MITLRLTIRFAVSATICLQLWLARTVGGQCHWLDLTKESRTAAGFSIAVNPQNDNTLFAGGFNLFASHDRGDTWEGVGLLNISTWALCASAAQPGVIYLGGFAPTVKALRV
jgi:hypothetical protein